MILKVMLLPSSLSAEGPTSALCRLSVSCFVEERSTWGGGGGGGGRKKKRKVDVEGLKLPELEKCPGLGGGSLCGQTVSLTIVWGMTYFISFYLFSPVHSPSAPLYVLTVSLHFQNLVVYREEEG